MKKILAALLVLVVLAGCAPANTTTDAQMATRVAQILTTYPTVVSQATLAPTQALPTVGATATATELAPTETATAAPTATATEVPATATLAATATLTTAPTTAGTQAARTATNTPGAAPTYTATPNGTPAAPTATPPASDPRTVLGSPTGTDTMDSADRWGWPTGADKFSSIDFKDGSMRLTGLTKDAGWRLPALGSTTNIYIEMTASPEKCSGLDNYGIILRIPVFKEPDRGYVVSFSCDGKYALWKWDGTIKPNGQATMLINWKANKAIVAGAGKTNRMGIAAIGSRLVLYANGVLLEEVKDSSLAEGYFGVVVNPDVTTDFTVDITGMSFWENPKF